MRFWHYNQAMTVWTDILRVATLAPSPHNVQPWKFRILNNLELELFLDPARCLPDEDLTGAFMVSTMGMMLEALRLSAANRGFETLEMLEDMRDVTNQIRSQSEPIKIAKVHLQKSTVTQTYGDHVFETRRTSRIAYRPETITAAQSKRLAALAAHWQMGFAQETDPTRTEAILEQNVRSVLHDLNTPSYQREIASWFRYSSASSAAHRDGLDARCMGLPAPLFWASGKMPWLSKIPILSNLIARIYRRRLHNAPTVAWLAGAFWEPQHAIQAGRFLLRFWLECAQLGLAIHPYGNLVTNPQAAAWMLERTGTPNIWLVFRIGQSVQVPPQSHRLPLETVLLPPNNPSSPNTIQPNDRHSSFQEQP
jgi:hypothetical protein